MILFALLFAAMAAQAQTCPDKNLNYWQAFPAGGLMWAQMNALAEVK